MSPDKSEIFPISQHRSIRGTRRLVREKVLQVLTAYEISGSPWQQIFSHVFFRDFNIEETETEPNKILTQDQVNEMEADTAIDWEDDDIMFGRQLIDFTISLRPEIDRMITEIAENWELDRIAIIDKILIQMAATELLKFPEIPSKVSINEAIDIAKKYSTEKSGTFINGVLDTLLEKLNSTQSVHKTGRGLVEG